jgi:putative FmdB family regulatory protein
LPLYAYRCTQCGHRFEKIQNFSSEQERVCPKCQGVLERPLTAPRLHFKGAGWYVNDYAPMSAAPASESGSESGPGGASDSGKGTAKPETKTPSTSTEGTASAPAAAPAPSNATSSAAPDSTSQN